MSDSFDMAKLLDLRKLTTAIADYLQGRLAGYLTTLQPLFQPHSVFGNTVQPAAPAMVKGADQAFAALQATYLRLAGSKVYNLPRGLEPPISIATGRPEISRVEYPYEAKDDGTAKSLTAVAPLRWVLSYAGFTPARLRGLLAQGDNVNERELLETLLHILVMDQIVTRQKGLGEILAALGFTIAREHMTEFGELPLTMVRAPVATQRPPDKIMLQIAEISGSPMFEEIVRVEDIVAMQTPLKDHLIEQTRSHAGPLLEAAGAK